jgi:hypothetical protein
MIHEVDDALRRLVREQALRGTDVEVAFDAPTRDWAARRNAPTVNVYLYDIREDLRRRERGLINVHNESGQIVSRRRPPRFVKLSYLVTAWTQRPEDEHRLLSALLLGCMRHEAVPPALLSGSLASLGLPVPMTIALPPPEDRAFADVWTALGGELKPSLDVVVSAPIDTSGQLPIGPLAALGVQLDVETDERVGHKVWPVDDDAGDGETARPAKGKARKATAAKAPAADAVAPPTDLVHDRKPPRITIVRTRTPRR